MLRALHAILGVPIWLVVGVLVGVVQSRRETAVLGDIV